jgi:thioredoxin reductase (NADPH)
MVKKYDLVILGGGPAGLTAAIYAGRYNMKTLVIAKSIGGTANLAGELENWPGYNGPGIELMNKFRDQVDSFGAEFLEVEIKSVEKKDDNFFVETYDGKIEAKSLIVALGTEHRQLDIPGEKKFLGKGVSYCATCDGNFFKGKDVAVIGGANAAAKAALYLSKICNKVYIVYRRHEMRCEPISLSKICGTENIEIHYYSNPVEIIGDSVVRDLKIITDWPDKDSTEHVIPVSGVFIEAGATPAVKVIKKLGLEVEKDYIVVDRNMKTNVEGVFAAGDVTNGLFKQITTAAGEGAIAAKMAHEFLMSK